MATQATKTATKSVLATTWGRSEKEASAAELQSAIERIDVNAQKTILDLKQRVSEAKTQLDNAINEAMYSHCFTAIVNANTAVAETEEALSVATAAKAKFLG
jgi:predicted S18 family serine protease